MNSDPLTISFPGGVAVDVHYGRHTVHTDQPVAAGGQDTALSPFDLFLASIAGCAGFYALRFCQQRELSTHGLGVTMTQQRDANGKRIEKLEIAVTLPDGFPEKYREAILRAIDQCTVKRHVVEPPEFAIAIAEPAVTAI